MKYSSYIRTFLLLFLCTVWTSPLLSQNAAEKAEPMSLFYQAIAEREQSTDPNAGQSLFEQAAQGFEALALENYSLWYEAGNARWWAGQAGLAILNYRRFLVHDPFRPEVWENLAQARLLAQTTEPGAEGLGAWPWSLLLLSMAGFSLSLAALFFSLRIFTKKKSFLLPSSLVGIFSGLLFLAALFFQLGKPQMGVVLQETQGRKGDAEVYAVWPEAALKQGQEVWIKEERDGWFHVEYGQTSTWLPSTKVYTLFKQDKSRP